MASNTGERRAVLSRDAGWLISTLRPHYILEGNCSLLCMTELLDIIYHEQEPKLLAPQDIRICFTL
jgi:hypothetical protein